jgi:dihydropyrimidinase
MVDLVIKNGLVVTPQGIIHGGVAVSEGCIVEIGADSNLPQANEVVDAQDLIVFPGLIDPHQHMGIGHPLDFETFKRDMFYEGIASVIGGVTTIITTHGGGIPQGQDIFTHQEKNREIASQSSLVDFKFTVTTFSDTLVEQFPRLVKEHGVTSFKFPLVYTGPEGKQIGVEEFGLGTVYKGFEKIAQIGPPALAMIHAEESAVIEVLKERLKSEGRKDLRAYSEARPNITETMDVFVCGLMSMHLNCPLYVVHTSAKESVDAIKYLKSQGVRVYGETLPTFLAPITMDADIGTIGVGNPPLRTQDDADRLWRGVAEGTMDVIGSDHCCYEHREDKVAGGIWKCLLGYAGTGAILPIMIEGIRKRYITWERMAKVCCENAARIFAMYPKKGALIPGADADIVIIDPDKDWTMGVATMKGQSDWSIWEGRKVKGKAMKTYVRGKLVQENGEPVLKPPHGAFVSPVGAHLSVPAIPLPL